MPIKSFPREQLIEVLYGSKEPLQLISNIITSHSRWSINYRIIFKDGDKFYSSYYSIGATEYQDESPWQYEKNEINCVEVKPVEKIITVYEEITEEIKDVDADHDYDEQPWNKKDKHE